MPGDINRAEPSIMHIDLNSCFATVEQQARPLLRGRPIAIVNRRTEQTAIVTASYEAKAHGVTVGMKFREAARLCPGLIAIESDPPKYRYVYHRLMNIMQDYSAHVRMKSIDEGVIDFSESLDSYKDSSDKIVTVGYEIKRRLRQEIGCAMRCNIGIATNRFLAKTAASLHKPDGLDVITAGNLRQVLGSLDLEDLTGIARRNHARLASVGIDTPLEFLETDIDTLQRVVFKSVVGRDWYRRLRGWEVDKRDFPVRTIGRQYVLESRNLDRRAIEQRLHHLCESVGGKVRSRGLEARGVSVYTRNQKYQYWQARQMTPLPFFTNQAIYDLARHLIAGAPDDIREIGVTCYELASSDNPQLSIFGDELARDHRMTDAVDEINSRYGERMIHSADTLGTGEFIKQKIPFSSTRFF